MSSKVITTEEIFTSGLVVYVSSYFVCINILKWYNNIGQKLFKYEFNAYMILMLFSL